MSTAKALLRGLLIGAWIAIAVYGILVLISVLRR